MVRKLKLNFPDDPAIAVLVWKYNRLNVHNPLEIGLVEDVFAAYPRHIGILATRIQQSVDEGDWEAARHRLYQAIDRAEWHEAIQEAHFEFAFRRNPQTIDWTFFEEMAESGKYPGFFEHFI